MKRNARLQAAIEILEALGTSTVPAERYLARWARENRFAGSKDRADIGERIFQVMRRRALLAWLAGSDHPRSLVIAALARLDGLRLDEIEDLFSGDGHAPAPLSDEERAIVTRPPSEPSDPWIKWSYPKWLHGELEATFGSGLPGQMAAVLERAPVDLRVNTLAADRPAARDALLQDRIETSETPFSPVGLRVDGPARITASSAYKRGLVEIQDEGSQLSALMVAAGPRHQVLDLCAGGGGKTLAMAAAMENTGQIYASDLSKARLKPLSERIARAAARNIQVLPRKRIARNSGFRNSMDRVVLDVPCSGSGAWRRHPDAKWRLSPDALQRYRDAQGALLEEAAGYVRPGGRIVYITCSLLRSENQEPVLRFLSVYPEFAPVDPTRVWSQGGLSAPLPEGAAAADVGILLTPAGHGTDGFFIAVMEKKDAELDADEPAD